MNKKLLAVFFRMKLLFLVLWK